MKIKTGFSLGLLVGMIAWGLTGFGIQEAVAICPDGSIPTENNPCAIITVCPADKMLCSNGTCADNIVACPTENNPTTSTGFSLSSSTSDVTAIKRCYKGCKARGGERCIKTHTGRFKCVGGKFSPR